MTPATRLILTGLTMLMSACHAAPALSPVQAAPVALQATKRSDPLRYKQQSVSVKDVDASAAFYTRHFGYKVTSRDTFPDLKLIVLERPDHRMQLMSGGKVAQLDWRHSPGYFAKDFDRMAATLPLLKPPFQVTPGGPRILFAKDPDGYPVEVIEDLPVKS
jgi:catechol 2,3-dioxygenase-like lactoylglutathione lyase family enzyme